MAEGSDDAGQLSATQQDALQQYLQVTGQDVKDAVPLLQRSQWNVQVTPFALSVFQTPRPSLVASNGQLMHVQNF